MNQSERQLVAGAAALMVLAISANAAAQSTDRPAEILVNGLARTYHLYQPRSAAGNERVALVVVLRGGFGTSAGAEQAYGWDRLADRHGFVVAYPDGLQRAWNAGGWCCGAPHRQGVDDVRFLTRMIERLVADKSVDSKRVYVTGMSNGALMAYRLACESPARLAAIGPVAGTMAVPCEGAPATSVVAIHGLAEQHMPFAGGYPRQGGYQSEVHRAVPNVIAQWRRISRCGPARVATAGAVTTNEAACDTAMQSR